MKNNRALINDFDVVRPAELLDKGLPIPGLKGRYVVDEGWRAVVTVDGVFKEILTPGKYSPGKYGLWSDVKVLLVDVRQQSLTIATEREFTIAHPAPIQIALDLSVEYRVLEEHARRVALELKKPLTSLYDRVIQSVRQAVVYLSVEEVRTQGHRIAMVTHYGIKAMNLPQEIGVEVLNVLVNRIQALDAQGDVAGQRMVDEWIRSREIAQQRMELQGTQITWPWLMSHRPEIAQQLIATYGDLAKELLEKGLLDPAAMLNQPMGGYPSGGILNPTDPLGRLPPMSGGTMEMSNPFSPPGSSPGMYTPPPTSDIHTRIREEVGYLESLPGSQVATKAGKDAVGNSDGSYDLRITLPRNSGGQITIYVVCPASYPHTPPVIEVEVDNQPTPFHSALIGRWNETHYLVEIVREVKQYIR